MKVLVLARNAHFAWRVALCLHAAGYCTEVWAGPEGAWLCRLSRHIHRFELGPLEDFAPARHRVLIEHVGRYCLDHRIDLLVPADLETSLAVAHHRRQLHDVALFPLAPPALLQELHDKWRFAQILQDCDLPLPQTRLVQRLDDFFALDLPYPVMAKPTDGEDGRGVIRLDQPEDLLAHLRAAQASNSLPLLVQEFIPGSDIDLSLLADHGRIVAWTIQQPGQTRGTLEFLEHRQVLDIGRSLIDYCHYHGVAHLDMRLDQRDGQVKVIECNPRFWGSLLYSLWIGVNFPRLGVLQAIGVDAAADFAPVTGSCTFFGPSPRRLLKALCHGRWVPRDLSPASSRSWRMNHLDPLPHLYGRFCPSRAPRVAAASPVSMPPAGPMTTTSAVSQGNMPSGAAECSHAMSLLRSRP